MTSKEETPVGKMEFVFRYEKGENEKGEYVEIVRGAWVSGSRETPINSVARITEVDYMDGKGYVVDGHGGDRFPSHRTDPDPLSLAKGSLVVYHSVEKARQEAFRELTGKYQTLPTFKE